MSFTAAISVDFGALKTRIFVFLSTWRSEWVKLFDETWPRNICFTENTLYLDSFLFSGYVPSPIKSHAQSNSMTWYHHLSFERNYNKGRSNSFLFGQLTCVYNSFQLIFKLVTIIFSNETNEKLPHRRLIAYSVFSVFFVLFLTKFSSISPFNLYRKGWILSVIFLDIFICINRWEYLFTISTVGIHLT